MVVREKKNTLWKLRSPTECREGHTHTFMAVAVLDSDEDEECGEDQLGRRYIRLPGLPCLCVAEVLAHERAEGDASGGMVRVASEELASWCCKERELLTSFSSALELGAGAGLIAIVLAKLGLARVVATDGDDRLRKLARDNAARNGVDAEQLRAVQYRWGDTEQLEHTLQAVGNEGRCSECIVASDVLYSSDESDFDLLESTLRALLRRGGCRLVAICWHVRNCNEERFLPRLADLGQVQTVWRSHGLSCEDACPVGACESAVAAWRSIHAGTWAIAVLRVASQPPD